MPNSCQMKQLMKTNIYDRVDLGELTQNQYLSDSLMGDQDTCQGVANLSQAGQPLDFYVCLFWQPS